MTKKYVAQFYQFNIPANSNLKTKEDIAEYVKEQWDEIKKNFGNIDSDITIEELLEEIQNAFDEKPQISNGKDSKNKDNEKKNARWKNFNIIYAITYFIIYNNISLFLKV